MKRSKSSKNWLNEHNRDVYVKRAKAEGFRSRAVYKLLGLQETDRIIKPGMVIVELGAAPGSWSQVLAESVAPQGHVYAVDLLAMPALSGVTFIQGDITENAVFEELTEKLGTRSVDVVLSDMAPNMSGITTIDQPRSLYLARTALDIAKRLLKPGGHFLIKVFEGQGFSEYLREVKSLFEATFIRKPDASRKRSSEMYLVAKGFRTSV